MTDDERKKLAEIEARHTSQRFILLADDGLDAHCDREWLIAVLKRLSAENAKAEAEAWDEGHSAHQDAHEGGCPSRPNPYRKAEC